MPRVCTGTPVHCKRTIRISWKGIACPGPGPDPGLRVRPCGPVEWCTPLEIGGMG